LQIVEGRLSDQRVERAITVEAPVREVWRALTDGEQLSAWFGAEAEIDPRPGGRVTFRRPDGTVRRASVEVADAPRLLVFRWLPFEHDAHGVVRQRPATTVRFTLRHEGDGTRLEIAETRMSEASARVPPGEVSPRPTSLARGTWPRAVMDR
jgi:uncharacterized protein YndB with AHSA1/START domain